MDADPGVEHRLAVDARRAHLELPRRAAQGVGEPRAGRRFGERAAILDAVALARLARDLSPTAGPDLLGPVIGKLGIARLAIPVGGGERPPAHPFAGAVDPRPRGPL